MASLKELTNPYDGRARGRRKIIELSLQLRQMLLGTKIEEHVKRESVSCALLFEDFKGAMGKVA